MVARAEGVHTLGSGGLCSGRARCRPTRTHGITRQAAWLEPAVGALGVAGALVVDVYNCDCSVLPWARGTGGW